MGVKILFLKVIWNISGYKNKKIIFKELNLAGDWPFMPQMDIVFLRNVLIYFDADVKKKILGKVRKLLRPGGFLFLGGAETTLNLDDKFERVVFGRATAYQVVP